MKCLIKDPVSFFLQLFQSQMTGRLWSLRESQIQQVLQRDSTGLLGAGSWSCGPGGSWVEQGTQMEKGKQWRMKMLRMKQQVAGRIYYCPALKRSSLPGQETRLKM